jgi:hypothetical protein
VTGSIERRRLFFCVTPLNILIAQAIRAREPGRDTIVYAPSLRSPKYQFYYDRFRWDKKVCASACSVPSSKVAIRASPYRRHRYD